MRYLETIDSRKSTFNRLPVSSALGDVILALKGGALCKTDFFEL